MRKSSIPLSVLSACDISREIWRQLNELRGLGSASWIECDLQSLGQRLADLRDDLGLYYAYEWGGDGRLRQATLDRSLPREVLSLFLQEQTQIYEMIAELADDVEAWVHGYDVAPQAIRAAMDRFRVLDALLISHESRKSIALHRR